MQSFLPGEPIGTKKLHLNSLRILSSSPRNAALGVGDGDDRAYPDQVIIREKESSSESEHRTLEARFSPIDVRQVQMSKLHTGAPRRPFYPQLELTHETSCRHFRKPWQPPSLWFWKRWTVSTILSQRTILINSHTSASVLVNTPNTA